MNVDSVKCSKCGSKRRLLVFRRARSSGYNPSDVYECSVCLNEDVRGREDSRGER